MAVKKVGLLVSLNLKNVQQNKSNICEESCHRQREYLINDSYCGHVSCFYLTYVWDNQIPLLST